MNSSLFLRGLVIGFSIAAPVGPIGVLCIRRTIADGWRSGLLSGLGAATADGLYGCIAGFGLTFISSFLVDQQFALRLVGGLFLCYLGVRTLLRAPTQEAAGETGSGLLVAYSSTFFLTLTNPITILSFAAIFAGVGGAALGSDYASAISLVVGVFIGSTAWWLTLSSVVALLKVRVSPTVTLWLNRVSGLVLLGFGVYALWGVVQSGLEMIH